MTDTTEQTLAILARHGWADLDSVEDEEFIERVASALDARDCDALITTIMGGASLGETAEIADAMLADND